MELKYSRKITHDNYKNSDKLKKYYHRVEKKIYESPPYYSNKEDKKSDYELINNNIIITLFSRISEVLIFGGISILGLFLITLRSFRNDSFSENLLLLIFFSVLSTLFIIYYFTMPTKEHILNREKSLITFTGVFWQKNITMPYNKVQFAYSTGSVNGTGSFLLQVIRPNKWKIFTTFQPRGGNCYESMSFICWYMDRNRPLPPGDIFDEFREQDFERRKAAGFPKPLYPSMIETPEFTKEQQAERKRIGGW